MRGITAALLALTCTVGFAQDLDGLPGDRDEASENLVLQIALMGSPLLTGENFCTLNITATITNRGEAPVTLVHPGDGSECGSRTPIVGWSLIKADDPEAKHPPTPPLYRVPWEMEGLRRKDVFVLPPGESKELGSRCRGATFPGPGTYKVVYYYVNDPAIEWKDERTRRYAMARLENTTKCSLVSNELVIDVEDEFPDNQRERVARVIKGQKGEQIKNHMTTLLGAAIPDERRKVEKELVHLICHYSLPDLSDDVPFHTWSAPAGFLSSPRRRLFVALLHQGTGHYVDFWIIHELEDGVRVFSFSGSEKGCGRWQVLNDLDEDGNPEIVVKNFVGDYEGYRTMAVWPAIYRWDGENYVRSDERFPSYYVRHVIPEYQEILDDHREWERIDNEQLRRVFRQCRFVRNKAVAICMWSMKQPRPADGRQAR